jgi:transposase-like protein
VVKVRDRGHVYPKALVIAYSVHETGRREVIGLDIGEIETEAYWVMFLRGLRERGLTGVRLCVSDEHLGLKNAIARVLGCPWQRCTVHFVRDMLRHCRPAQRGMVSAALREIFNADSHDSARERCGEVIQRLHRPARKVAGLLEAAEEDLLASTVSRPRTGLSCAPPTRWSASTARSGGARTSSGSSPTTPARSGSPARC